MIEKGRRITRIRKERLGEWIDRLEPMWRVVFPAAGACGQGPRNQRRLVPGQGERESLKGILMPLENLLEGEESGSRADERPVLVWGVRPCDLRGTDLIDRIFSDRLEDPAYARRRAGIAFAGFACTSRGPACFCELMGVDRTGAEGMDIVLVEQEGGFLAAGLTGAGERMVEAGRDLLEEAGGAGRAELDAALDRAAGEDRAGSPESVTRALEGLWKSDIWKRISDTCLGCGVCSFVCPLCWCFDVRDVPGDMMRNLEGGKPKPLEAGGTGVVTARVRCWDSCQLGHYGRMAGGADPYADAAARVRHRIYHKLSYIPREYGMIGCTGCGRCVQACPSGLDMRAILSELAAEEKP